MITLHAVTRLLLIKEITHPHRLTCFPLLDGGLVAQPTQGADLGPSGDNEPNLRLIQAYLLLVLDPAYPHSLQKISPFSARSAVPATDCLFLFESGSIFLFLPALSLNHFRLTSSDLTHLALRHASRRVGGQAQDKSITAAAYHPSTTMFLLPVIIITSSIN